MKQNSTSDKVNKNIHNHRSHIPLHIEVQTRKNIAIFYDHMHLSEI